jgi:hypothetical protein
MKALQTLRIPLTTLTLLVASNAFAANRGSLHVSSPEDVAGKQLAAGDYSVRWDNRASGVELTIMQGNRVVATATADAVPLQGASISNSVVINIEKGERARLSQIFFAGQRIAFEIREPLPDRNSASSNQGAAALPSSVQ